MYYVSIENGEVAITSYVPDTEYFEIEEPPIKPYVDEEKTNIILQADFINKEVWYDVEYIPQKSQLDVIEALVRKSHQDIIDEYTLSLINQNIIL